MTRSIVVRVWLSILALTLLLLGVVFWAVNRLMASFYYQQVVEPLLYHAQQYAQLIDEDPKLVTSGPMVAGMVGGGVQVYSAAGSLSYAAPEAYRKVIATALTEADRPITGLLVSDAGEQIIGAGVPLDRGGTAVLLAPAAPLQHALHEARRYLWLALLGSGLVSTGLALWLAKQVTRPVLRMKQAAQVIARGDYTIKVPVERPDEVGELALAVNELSESLNHYERQRREFLANMAHELRTPLSYVRGYSQALADGLVADPAEQQQYLQVINQEAARLGSLVEDLMNLSELEEGHLSLSRDALDLAEVVQTVTLRVGPRAQQAGVTLVAAVRGLPPVWADGARVVQVLLNLVDNALRFTPAGGTIRIAGETEGDFVHLQVQDTGPGIPEPELKLIWERFHKVDRSRSTGGRGLGLAIVRSIIRTHGGQAWATNRPQGGAAFHFTLPLHTQRAASL